MGYRLTQTFHFELPILMEVSAHFLEINFQMYSVDEQISFNQTWTRTFDGNKYGQWGKSMVPYCEW